MEQEYVIGVANRYALFLEESSHEEDPYDIIKYAEAEKTKKKTLKSVSGESKENKGKQNLKGKTTLPSTRKTQGIKETQNVRANEAVAVNKTKPQDGGLKNNNSNNSSNINNSNNNHNNNNNNTNNRAVGARKTNDKPQGDRPQVIGDGQSRTVKFASGEPQGERPNNRRFRDDKASGERNGEVPRNRNFRDGERGPNKGPDFENFTRGSRNEDGRRGPRRDGERPFRGDRDRNDRQSGDGENKPPRRENRDRRDFQERTDIPREGMENGEARQERRGGGLSMGWTKGVGRGGGPGRNFENRGKREFDRKSGSDKTGIKAMDKRDGGGAHNWGSHKEDMEATNLNWTIGSEENVDWSVGKSILTDNGVSEAKDVEKNNTDNENVLSVEEEPKELTLDEYRALRGKRELPQYNIRKAGEGEDLTQWKNMYEIKKKKDSVNHEEEEEFDATECPQKGGRQRLLLDIDITFSDSRRGTRGGRGGRPSRPGGLNSSSSNPRPRQRDGARRGGRDDYGGGRDRQYRGSNQAAPKVDDERDFPSLG